MTILSLLIVKCLLKRSINLLFVLATGTFNSCANLRKSFINNDDSVKSKLLSTTVISLIKVDCGADGETATGLAISLVGDDSGAGLAISLTGHDGCTSLSCTGGLVSSVAAAASAAFRA